MAEPTPQELLEQLRQVPVSDLLLSAMSSAAQLGFARLEPEGRDLAQARLAIEAVRALVGVLQETLPQETLRGFEQVVADLQLAYASAVSTS